MKTRRLLLLVLAYLLLSTAVYPEELTGKVISIKDGDTIEILVNNRPIRIRLYGIDCPEKTQAFGQKARQFTADKVFGKVVKVQIKDKDRYGRYVGIVTMQNRGTLNYELVKVGYAWWYRQYSKDPLLEAYERGAREKKLGLWADPHPVAPWDFRRGKAESYNNSTKKTNQSLESSVQRTVYITKSGKKYHLEDCSFLKHGIQIKLSEAKARRYTPCRLCKPPLQ